MKKTAEKNQETLDKNIIPAQEIVSKQEEKKATSISAILNKLSKPDEEYDAKLAEIRKRDFINTRALKLKEVKIPGYQTIWASTDPKAKPSTTELEYRGYRKVNDIDFVETGSHSVQGAGYHILMACPQDIADMYKAALDKRSKDDMDKVFKKKVESQDGSRDFIYQKNKLENKN